MHKSKLVIAIPVIFLFSTNALAVVDAEKSYEAGIKAYRKGQYKKAINLLEQAIDAGLSTESRNRKVIYLHLYYIGHRLQDKNKKNLYEKECMKRWPNFRDNKNDYISDMLFSDACITYNTKQQKEALRFVDEALEFGTSLDEALLYAVFFDMFHIIQYLLENGADVNAMRNGK